MALDDERFVKPSLCQLAQAICLAKCAKFQFGGCTFDGQSCGDAPVYEREAQKALQNA